MRWSGRNHEEVMRQPSHRLIPSMSIVVEPPMTAGRAIFLDMSHDLPVMGSVPSGRVVDPGEGFMSNKPLLPTPPALALVGVRTLP